MLPVVLCCSGSRESREQRPALRARVATEDEDRVLARAGDSSVSHNALLLTGSRRPQWLRPSNDPARIHLEAAPGSSSENPANTVEHLKSSNIPQVKLTRILE